MSALSSLSHTLKKFSLAIVLGLPFILFCWLSLRFNSPGPIYEEYHVLNLLARLAQAESFTERWQIFFTPYTNYTLYLAHAVFVTLNTVMGYVDFRLFTVFNIIATLLLSLLMLKPFKSSPAFVSIAFMVLSLSFYIVPVGHIAWSSGGFITTLTCLSLLLALYFLHKSSVKSFCIALMFSAAALHGLVNGLLLIPAAACLWFFTSKASNDKQTAQSQAMNPSFRIAAFIIISGLLALPYLQALNLQAGLSFTPTIAYYNGFERLLSSIRLLGAGFAFGHLSVSLYLGFIFIGLMGFLIKMKTYQKHPVLSAYLTYLLGTIVMIGFARDWPIQPYYSHSSRYLFFSMQAWIICLALLMEYCSVHFNTRQLQKLFGVSALISLIGLGFNYKMYLPDYRDACVISQQKSLAALHMALNKRQVLNAEHDAIRAQINILKKVVDAGIIRPQNLLIPLGDWPLFGLPHCKMEDKDRADIQARFERSMRERHSS